MRIPKSWGNLGEVCRCSLTARIALIAVFCAVHAKLSSCKTRRYPFHALSVETSEVLTLLTANELIAYEKKCSPCEKVFKASPDICS